jgi:hypothetical protein
MANKISNSSSESIKLYNRLSKIETDTRLDLDDNIVTYRAVCFTLAGGFQTWWDRLSDQVDPDAKISEFGPKEAFLDSDNNPQLVTDGNTGEYYQCFVYYVDLDPPTWDPRTTNGPADPRYWARVKRLHKALFPKDGSKPSNESRWKIQFLKGGPNRNEWNSGLAIQEDQNNYYAKSYDNQSVEESAPSSAPTANANKGRPEFMDTPPAKGPFYQICKNGVIVTEPGQKPDYNDPAKHEENLKKFNEFLEQYQEENTSVPWESQNITMQEFKDSDFGTEFGADAYFTGLASKESAGDYTAYNQFGYLGANQVGWEAMILNGYLGITTADAKKVADKTGKRYTKKSTEAVFLASDFTDPNVAQYYTEEQLAELITFQEAGDGAGMVQVFLGSQTLQDNFIAKYTVSRIKTMTDNNRSGRDMMLADFSDMPETSGFVMGSHLRGFGAINPTDLNFEPNTKGNARSPGVFEYEATGQTSADANDTRIGDYVDFARTNYLNTYGNPCGDNGSGGEPTS